MASPYANKVRVDVDDSDDDTPLATILQKKKTSNGADTSGAIVGTPNRRNGNVNGTRKQQTGSDDDDDVPLSQIIKAKSKPHQPQKPNPQLPKNAQKKSVKNDKGREDNNKIGKSGFGKTAQNVTKATVQVKEMSSESGDDKPLSHLIAVKKSEKIDSDPDDDVPLSERAKQIKLKVAKTPNTSKNEVVNDEGKPKKKSVKIEKKGADDLAKKNKSKKRKKGDDDGDEQNDEDEDEDGTDEEQDDQESSSKGKKKGKKKKEEEEEEVWEWWKEEPLPEGKTWRTLEHNGVYFPPPYVPHGIKLLYNGKPVDLTPEQEEAATYFAQYLETDHNKKAAFRKNFWNDFRQMLNKEQKKVLLDFDKCDFTAIHKYLMGKKDAKKNRSTEEKKKEKEESEKLRQQYGFAIVDGHRERIANFKVEPPGLFLGRGAHPKAGCIKKRVMPEDITINIGKNAKIPEPPPGHKWKEVVHDDTVAWLAMWKENINEMFKYVWLAPSSRVKGMSDMQKFDVARKLKNHIDKIRKNYYAELKNDDSAQRQLATALYFIDTLALRVGNEKGDDEADTVGCCSLRIEHIELTEPDTVKLDFLGKDSMRYLNTVTVDKRVFKNLKEFMYKHEKGKKVKKNPGDNLFEELTTTALNKYLKDQMSGLSAKVFRTFNASITLERELAKMPKELMKASVEEKVLFYNRCNRQVAILCNHQRSLPKNFVESMAKIDEKVRELEDRKKKLKAHLLWLQGKGPKPEESDEDGHKDDKSKKQVKTEKVKQGDDDFQDEQLTDKSKGRNAKRKREDDAGDDFQEETPKKKSRKLSDDPEKVKQQIDKLNASINKWMIKKTERDELKTVALGTSKINYIDPRITAAWCKHVSVPIDKIFSKALREKFPWAMDAPEDWKF